MEQEEEEEEEEQEEEDIFDGGGNGDGGDCADGALACLVRTGLARYDGTRPTTNNHLLITCRIDVTQFSECDGPPKLLRVVDLVVCVAVNNGLH